MRTTIRSRSAFVLAIVFAIATAAMLLWDVRSLGDTTPDHFTTLGTLLGTIAAGHFFTHCWQHRQWLYAMGLALGFCAGTFICVTGSAGRGGETILQRSLAAAKVNEARKQTIDELAESRARRVALASLADKECGGGEGVRCKGARSSVTAIDSHIAILQARLDGLPAEQVANVKFKKAADVIVFFSGADRERTEHGLELLWPFANALIWEVLTIVFFGISLGYDARKLPSPVASDNQGVRADRNKEFIPHWANGFMELITGADVLAVINAAVARGSPYAAHHAWAYARRIFNYAIARGVLDTRHGPRASRDIIARRCFRMWTKNWLATAAKVMSACRGLSAHLCASRALSLASSIVIRPQVPMERLVECAPLSRPTTTKVLRDDTLTARHGMTVS